MKTTKLSNSEALNLCITYHNQFSQQKLNAIVDLELNVVASNNYSAKLGNAKDGTFIGKKLLEDVSTPERAPITAKNFTECIQQRKKIRFFSFRLDRVEEYRFLVFCYEPIINLDTDEVIAVLVSAEPVDYPVYFYKIERIIKKTNKRLLGTLRDKLLTPREHEVIFLLFQYNNYAEIAHVLTIAHNKILSGNAIAKIISRNLYNKLNVINLEALKKCAHLLGYHKKIPPSLFGEFIYRLDEL